MHIVRSLKYEHICRRLRCTIIEIAHATGLYTLINHSLRRLFYVSVPTAIDGHYVRVKFIKISILPASRVLKTFTVNAIIIMLVGNIFWIIFKPDGWQSETCMRQCQQFFSFNYALYLIDNFKLSFAAFGTSGWTVRYIFTRRDISTGK